MPQSQHYPSPKDLDVEVHVELTCSVDFWVLVNVLIIHILSHITIHNNIRHNLSFNELKRVEGMLLTCSKVYAARHAHEDHTALNIC